MSTGSAERFDAVVGRLKIDDLLVFSVSDTTARLTGGTGRGAGWAETVTAELKAEPLLREAVGHGSPVRVDGAKPRRIVGPYWAAHAVVVPVSGEHVVVLASRRRILATLGDLIGAAAEAVSVDEPVPPSKLLIDELEVVHAVRGLMAYRPLDLEDTARHIAATAAGALSCELGAVLVRHGDRPVVGLFLEGLAGIAADDRLTDGLEGVYRRALVGPVVEQELTETADDVLGSRAGLVARFAVPIGAPSIGVLVVAHARSRPRGFTNLCQRIGRAVADSAELLLEQAIAREELTAERDRFAIEARTDALTGIANRVAWQESIAAETARQSRYGRPCVVISVDLDALKATNDAYGHEAGDRLLIAAADVLRSSARASDFVARAGGDEFGIFMPESDESSARTFGGRIAAACAAWSVANAPLALNLSIGFAAPGDGEDLRAALRRADERMYESKRAGRHLGDATPE